jgi:hypothetical protein
MSPNNFHIASFFAVSIGIVGVEGRAKRPKGLEERIGEGGTSGSVEESLDFGRGEAGG